MKTDQQLMDDFFDTHSYNEEDDWRKEPLTALDPDEDEGDVSKGMIVGDQYVPTGTVEVEDDYDDLPPGHLVP